MVETKIVPSQPALILEGKKRSLVVSDLHIGFESNLVTNKIFIGKNTTTQETINAIEDIIDFVKADTLILLGDVKSSIKSITKYEWEDVPKFIKNILLTHGHTMPTENFSHVDKIIMGHVHPVFFQEDSVLNGQRVWISIKTEKQNIFPSTSGELEIIVVPSFNKYFYATHKKHYKKSISPILEKIKIFSSNLIFIIKHSYIFFQSRCTWNINNEINFSLK